MKLRSHPHIPPRSFFDQIGAFASVPVAADILAQPAVVLISVTAFHRLDVAAVLLIEIVREYISDAVNVIQLRAPFVPPRDGDDLGMNGEDVLPLSVPEAASLPAVCRW